MLRNSFRAVIIGAPGSGKGTISKRIVNKFKLDYLASGDILRKHIENKTNFGNEIEEFIKNGKLVPDNLMISCIVDEMKKTNNNFLLDGFPRTIVQAEKLSEMVKLDTVFYLNVPFNVIVDRIKDRWIHLSSGRVYNINYNAPKIPFKDDITGESLIQRDDDRPEAVQKRLNIFELSTKPVLEFYKNQNILKEFYGTTSNAIWEDLEKYLDKEFSIKK